MRGVVVVPFTPSDPRWPALAAALLTSVVGQRNPCIILPDPSEYVRVGDDLGGAQRLAVMAVDFGRWGKRLSVGFAPPCGGHAKLRQRQSLQRELYAADRQRLAAALLRLSRIRAGVAVEAACFLVRKYKSGCAGDVRLLTATPPSPPPGNEPGPGVEVPNLGGKRGAGNHARADAVRRDRARDQQVVIG